MLQPSCSCRSSVQEDKMPVPHLNLTAQRFRCRVHPIFGRALLPRLLRPVQLTRQKLTRNERNVCFSTRQDTYLPATIQICLLSTENKGCWLALHIRSGVLVPSGYMIKRFVTCYVKNEQGTNRVAVIWSCDWSIRVKREGLHTYLNFSCPAVSHSCNLIILSSASLIFLELKSTPTVGSRVAENFPSLKDCRRDDFPTVLSPIRITRNW